MQVRNHPKSNKSFCTNPTVRERQWRSGVAQGEGLSDAPVSRRGEGHGTLPSSTATDYATGNVALARVMAALAAQGQQFWV